MRVDAGQPPSTQRRGYEECFLAFIAEARALPASAVISFRGDARLALANARMGLDNTCADAALVEQHLPMVPVERALETADVARALVHAEMCAEYKPGTPKQLADVVKRMAKPRRQMIDVATTLADHGLLPATDVATLGRRGGLPIMADDAIMVAGLFTRHADAIRGKHPFTQKQVDDLRRDAEWVREHTNPQGARKPEPKRDASLQGDCDRLWTLLVQRHALLQSIAGYFHRAAMKDRVPPLQSRVRASIAAADEPAPVPPAPNG